MSKDFAVIKINSKQYTVEEGSRLKVDRIAKSSDIAVLLIKTGEKTIVGEPIVENVGVKAEVIQESKDKKISVRRYKSKSRYRKNVGHRQPISTLKIIEFGEDTKPELVWKIEEDLSSSSESEKDPKQSNVEKKDNVSSKVESTTDTDKGDDKITNSIKDLDISDSIKQKLEEAGYKTSDDLKKAGKDEIIKVKGVGEKAVEKLFTQL